MLSDEILPWVLRQSVLNIKTHNNAVIFYKVLARLFVTQNAKLLDWRHNNVVKITFN